MEVRLAVCAVALVFVTFTGSNALSDDCGKAPLNPKIIGGEDAPAGAWPWQVSLQILNQHLCGGSLINNQWVLTAAQCYLDGSKPSDYKVYLGRTSLETTTTGEQIRSVSNIIKHPNFDDKTFNNDIALVKLSSPVNFTNYIQPVCLATNSDDFNTGQNCWVTGWGQYRNGVELPSPQKLQQVLVPIISNSDCNDVYGLITHNMMCTSTAGGKGTCAGDAGGPLVKKINSKWVQGGVASFVSAAGCALPGAPAGFARVSQYKSWINSHISSGVAQLSAPLLLSISLVLSSVFILS